VGCGHGRSLPAGPWASGPSSQPAAGNCSATFGCVYDTVASRFDNAPSADSIRGWSPGIACCTSGSSDFWVKCSGDPGLRPGEVERDEAHRCGQQNTGNGRSGAADAGGWHRRGLGGPGYQGSSRQPCYCQGPGSARRSVLLGRRRNHRTDAGHRA
jgi:hypothetical protein